MKYCWFNLLRHWDILIVVRRPRCSFKLTPLPDSFFICLLLQNYWQWSTLAAKVQRIRLHLLFIVSRYYRWSESPSMLFMIYLIDVMTICHWIVKIIFLNKRKLQLLNYRYLSYLSSFCCGPGWLSNGQRTRLILWWSKFKSCWSLQFLFYKKCLKKNEQKWKREWPT